MVDYTVIIQARMSSTRLPGKVLKTVQGNPILEHLICRLNQSEYIDKVIVATSTHQTDDKIETFCSEKQYSFFRGDLDDVLKRFYECSLRFPSKYYIRITADCPLHDINLIDKAILHFKNNNLDYLTNTNPPSFPDGLDFWIFTNQLLHEAHIKAIRSSEREHVTLFLNNNFNKYKAYNLISDKDLEHLRWTVDTPKDFELIKRIFDFLYPSNPHFLTEDILKLIESKPILSTLNKDSERDEGLMKSLSEEKDLI